MSADPGANADQTLRFFFDKNVGKSVPEALRGVGLDVQIFSEEYGSDLTEDDDTFWIVPATNAGRIIVGKDGGIRKNPVEREAFRNAGGQLFLLQNHLRAFHMLRSFLSAWSKIVDVVETRDPPFIFGIDARGGIHEKSLDP